MRDVQSLTSFAKIRGTRGSLVIMVTPSVHSVGTERVAHTDTSFSQHYANTEQRIYSLYFSFVNFFFPLVFLYDLCTYWWVILLISAWLPEVNIFKILSRSQYYLDSCFSSACEIDWEPSSWIQETIYFKLSSILFRRRLFELIFQYQQLNSRIIKKSIRIIARIKKPERI